MTTVFDPLPEQQLHPEQAKTLARLASGIIDLGLTAQGYDPHKEIRARETKLSVYASSGAIFAEAVFFVRVKPAVDKDAAESIQAANETTTLYGLPVYTAYATLEHELMLPEALFTLLRSPRRLSEFNVLVY